jgi:hypothetical protein
MWMRCSRVILIILSLSACTARDVAPELRDPIYLSLNTEVLSAQKSLEDLSKELAAGRAEFEKSELSTGTPRHQRVTKLFEVERSARLGQQRVDYLIARRAFRLKEDRMEYNAAMNSGQEWPIKGQFAQYELGRSLAQRTRNYTQVHEDRMKRLLPRAPASKAANKESPKE